MSVPNASPSIYDSKGELKKWAHMDKDELRVFRNSIESELSAGNIPSKDLQYLKDIVIPDIDASLENLLNNPAGTAVPAATSPVKPSSPTTATKSVSNSAQASAQSPVRAGRQVNSSTSVPSRTNVPGSVSARSAPTTAGASSSGRPTISFGKRIVDDNPALGEGHVFVSGTQAGSAQITAKISTSGAKDAAGQAAKHASQSSARTVGHTASKLVASGAKDSKNLRIAGAAAILAVGTLAMRGRSKSSAENERREHERNLMMQREGYYNQR